MSFAEIKPQLEQLPRDEMLKLFAFAKSRLRAETAENRSLLSHVGEEMDGGKVVRWEDLKKSLGL